MEDFPTKTTEQNGETKIPQPDVVPQEMELTGFWREIGALSTPRKDAIIEETFAPYEGGSFLLKWDNLTHEYGFIGLEQNEKGDWYFRLENKEFTEDRDLSEDKLRKMQEEHGVVYPKFPVEYEFLPTNGGPIEGFISLPEDAASQEDAVAAA